MLSILRFRCYQTVRHKIKYLNMLSSVLKNHFLFSTTPSNFKHLPTYKKSSLPDYKEGGFRSQYIPPTAIVSTEERIKEYLLENNPMTYDQWLDAKEYFYTEMAILSDMNYSSIVMNVLLNSNDIKRAQSFMKYLQESNLKPNILAYLQYIALCGKNYELCAQSEIIEIYQKIQNSINSSPVLDIKRATYLIQGLCGTDLWRSAFDYLKKLPCKPTCEINNSLASAAIRNGDEALAWEIVIKWFNKTETLSNSTIKEFLKHASNLLGRDRIKGENFILNVFSYMQQNDIVFDVSAAQLVEEFFRRHPSKWEIFHTKVSRKGECETCCRILNTSELSDMEFTRLKKSFLERSVMKTDIFINSTVEEFNKFISFLEEHKPFHIVIDGLNVAHTTKTTRSPINLAQHLLNVVDRISSRSRRVLVLGRKHMNRWPKHIMTRIAKRSVLFLTSNISQDDPYTVYATLASGPNTYVLTNDLMRDHFARLDDSKLIALFKRWQLANQVLLNVDEDNKFTLIEPVRHSISTQGVMEHGWHIPYDDEIIREPYEELNNWLCIRKIKV